MASAGPDRGHHHRVKQDLREQLEWIGRITHIGPERISATLPVALEAFEQRHATARGAHEVTTGR